MKQVLQLLELSHSGFAQKRSQTRIRSVSMLPGYRKLKALLLLLIVCLFNSTSFAQDIVLGLTSSGGKGGAGTAFSIKSTGADFSVLKTFDVSGRRPSKGLCEGTDGHFYGMTEQGGVYGEGTIFQMISTGSLKILHSFKSSSDGGYPQGSLVQGADGSFYGMTRTGGTHGFEQGTIFKITAGGTFTVLHHFNGATDGKSPLGSLVEGTDGKFYGMAWGGGTNNAGTIFNITPGGTFTVLHHLNNNLDGGNPRGKLVQGTDGKYYGMAWGGGTNNVGTIFSITASGVFTVIRHLNTATDGGRPFENLIIGTDGNFYGLNNNGGTYGYGTFFKINKSGTLTVLHHFTYNDGGYPGSNLVLGSDGNFYGTTFYNDEFGYSNFYKLTSGGAFYVISSIPSGNSSTTNRLIQGRDGDFYVTMSTYEFEEGLIFKLTSTGAFSYLVEFPESSKGLYPQGSLVHATDGNFYGMTYSGADSYNSKGTIFKMCNSSYSNLAYIDNKDVSRDGIDKKPYYSNLIQGTDGHFYGMTYGGDNGSGGTIFRVTSAGIITVLHSFTYYDGVNPFGSLVQGSDGNFYGMTSDGGGGNWNIGTLFKITPSGVFTVLQRFDNITGSFPHGNLIKGSDGNFYGMTTGGGTNGGGTIFKMTPSGTLTVLRQLSASDGTNPFGSLVKGTDGNFYGMTSKGGTNGAGTIFKMTSGGTLTVLRHLNQSNDGANPRGSLVQGSGGSFYGMTNLGGTYNGGTVFKITTAGVFTVLRHLNPEQDGSNPHGSLIVQKADPIANAQSVSTAAGTVKSIILTGSAPGTPLTYTIVAPPQHGTLSGSGATRTYTPQPGFTGSDAFTFTITWGCQTSAPQTVSITVTNPTITLAPVADALVRNSRTYAAINYGNETTLTVKNSPKGGYTRYTYLKFTLDNVSSVSSAKLRIYGRNVQDADNITMAAFGVNNDSWTETGINWYNKPYAYGASLSTVVVSSQEQYYELDVTSFVQAQLSGDKVATIVLKDPARQNRNLTFNSKEHAAHPPQLILQTTAGNILSATNGGSTVRTSLSSSKTNTYLKEHQVSLYPNPASSKVTIKLTEPAQQVATTITDLTGAVHQSNTHRQIDKTTLELGVTALPAAVYLLHIRTEHGQKTLKFIRQ